MCANVPHSASHEHDVFDRKGRRLSRRRRQNAAALGSRGPLETRANRHWQADVFQDGVGCLHATDAVCRKSAVVYGRVSRAAQKPDLKNQRRVLEEFCAARGLANVEFVEEVGGGLDLKCPKFLALMDRIEAAQVAHLIIAPKDRLVRFGFSWFERFCSEHGAELLVLNQEQLSPEQEMVQDC